MTKCSNKNLIMEEFDCPECGGTGYLDLDTPCDACDGAGHYIDACCWEHAEEARYDEYMRSKNCENQSNPPAELETDDGNESESG